MQTLEEIKSRAQKLRAVMSANGNPLKHSQSLEVVSQLDGFADWNTYSAFLNKSQSLLPLPADWFATGDNLEVYEYGCDLSQQYNGIPSAVIRSKDNNRPVHGHHDAKH